jgi:hypothetical protein
MGEPEISTTAVLGGLLNGSRSIWDLASLFQVPAGDRGLRRSLGELIAAGTVVASDVNIYSATLEVTE